MAHRREKIGQFVVTHDPVVTAETYRKVKIGGAEECRCSMCRNFVAARSLAYPPRFLDLLEQLGIALDREVEAYHNARLQDGTHSYGGWFHFIGNVDSAPDAMEEVSESFRFNLTNDAHMVDPLFASQGDVAAIEFSCELPWLLDEPEPE